MRLTAANGLGTAVVRSLFWLIPLGFYVTTGSRTPGWADAALISRTVNALDFQIWANNHNLFTLVAAGWVRLLPDFIEFHHALNLLCALLGALTVQVVFLIGLRLTANTLASALGAFVLMLSHSLWWHSTMLEVYTLSTLLLGLTVLFVLRYEQDGGLRDLCGAAFCFGLGCSNHAQLALLLFGFLPVLFWSEQRRTLLTPRSLTLLGVSFLVGFQVYGWVFASELVTRLGGLTDPMQALGSVLGSMIHETTGGGFRQYMFPTGLSLSERSFWWLFYAGFFVYNFPSAALLFGAIGAWAWLHGGNHKVTLTFFAGTFIAQLVWSSNYLVWDMYAFSLPVYTLFAILVIIGIDWACRQSRPLRLLVYLVSPSLFISPILYSKAAGWVAANETAIELLETLPQYGQARAFWDPLSYFFDPNKRQYDRVQRYSDEVLSRLDPAACYWGDEAKLLYPLKYYYQDVLGRRKDVDFELIFGILDREPEFATHAIHMLHQLKRGCSVYVESLGYPERDVLNHVYALLDRRVTAARAADLPEAEFLDTFPRYRFVPIDVDRSLGVRIFQLLERGTP